MRSSSSCSARRCSGSHSGKPLSGRGPLMAPHATGAAAGAAGASAAGGGAGGRAGGGGGGCGAARRAPGGEGVPAVEGGPAEHRVHVVPGVVVGVHRLPELRRVGEVAAVGQAEVGGGADAGVEEVVG